MNKKSLLIIKTGESESFIPDSSHIISLGDVLRSTVLLRKRAEFNNIYWLTSSVAVPLISKKHMVNVSILSSAVLASLPKIDKILNLERSELSIPFIQRHAQKVIGYIPTESGWMLKDRFGKVHSLNEWLVECESRGIITWGAKILELIGLDVNIKCGVYEKPHSNIKFDVGLNFEVGKKWPSKQVAKDKWEKVHNDLSQKYSVSWQMGFDNLGDYANWIASNRMIISLDSLGLHLAMAMDIPTIGVFGATDPMQLDRQERSKFLQFAVSSSEYSCFPCLQAQCTQKIHCSEFFPYTQIYKEVDRILS